MIHEERPKSDLCLHPSAKSFIYVCSSFRLKPGDLALNDRGFTLK